MKLQKVLATFKHVFVKRKYKDILFRYIFRGKKELLQLYNAINGTHYTNPEDLVVTTMENIIYVGMENDVSFILGNDMNLYEHQSTIDENMPLRGFFYFAKMYESYISMHELNRHQRIRLALPFPRFIVFYNGEREMPETLEMRLSDSFEQKEGTEPAVECVAKFININYGNNIELLNSCRRLHDYSYFVDCVRKYLRRGRTQKEAIARAVDECIEADVLKDVLLKHRTEVEGMFLSRFDKKMYEQAMREDAKEWARRDALVEARKEVRAEVQAEVRAEVQAEVRAERQRADAAELKIAELEREIARLKEMKSKS